jgi:hypothetical protein
VAENGSKTNDIQALVSFHKRPDNIRVEYLQGLRIVGHSGQLEVLDKTTKSVNAISWVSGMMIAEVR